MAATSSTMEFQASATRMQSRSRVSAPWSGARKIRRLPRYLGFVPLVPHTVEHAFVGEARFLAGVELLRGQHNQTQCAIVWHIAVRGEDMCAVKEGRARGELLNDLRHPPAHFILVLEPLLPFLHLAAEIGAGVEPVAGRIL